jgi:DNA-binding CsgD family transcriptional regulator
VTTAAASFAAAVVVCESGETALDSVAIPEVVKPSSNQRLAPSQSAAELTAAPHGDTAALMHLAERLARCSTLDEFENVYLRGAKALLGPPMQGIYLFDPGTLAPQRVKAVNVSDAFLERYERHARPLDPLLQHVMATGEAISNVALMSMEEWLESPLYAGYSWIHEMRYTMEAPVLVEDQVAGMLCCSATDSTPGEWRERLAVLAFLGRIVGITVQGVRDRERLDQRYRQVLDALDLAGTALLITDVTGADVRTNPAAQELLDGLADRDRLLYALAASTTPGDRFAHRVPAHMHDGTEVTVRASSRRSEADPSTLVTILELEGAEPQSRSPALQLLTPREREVAGLVAEGLTDGEIAERLCISRHTVNQHVKRAYQTLDVHNRVGLARVVLDRAG